MDYAALRAEIVAKCSPELLASRDTQAITDAVNVGRTRIAETLGGIGLVLETLGPTDGAALLDNLEAMSAENAPLRWAFVLINRGDLDFGSPATRAMIDQLLTPTNAATLKAVAEVADPVSELDVRRACYADNGDWLA